MQQILDLLFLSLIGSIFALLGGLVFLYNRRLSNSLQKYSIPFAAGVLITVSLLALVPEAFELLGEQSLVIVLLSFFGAYFFEYFLVAIHHHDKNHGTRRNSSSLALVIIGDTIHNFIDGIAIAMSFFASPGLGLATALSTFLHEIPHEIGDFGILLSAGWKRKKILLVNVISASFTIVGAFLSLFVAENKLFTGVMLSVSAGIFLYLGAIDFLPQVTKEKEGKSMNMFSLALGIIVMLITLVLVPHSD